MKDLVFRFCLLVAFGCQLTAAERSANGYFYDKPDGISFEETPGSDLLLAAPQPQRLPQTVTTSTSTVQDLQPPPIPFGGGLSNLQIIPATLIYEDTKTFDAGLQSQQQPVQDGVVNYLQSQSNYRANLQPVEFTIQGASGAQQPCGVQPIVAQINPSLVNLSNGGPLTRVITTCGPNNNCNTITVQSDLKRHLGVQAVQGPQFGAVQQSFVVPEARSAGKFEETIVVRPPNRRLVEITEIERNDPYN